jgi:hypothetical protein
MHYLGRVMAVAGACSKGIRKRRLRDKDVWLVGCCAALLIGRVFCCETVESKNCGVE